MNLTQLSIPRMLWQVGVPSMIGIIFQSGMQLVQMVMALLYDAGASQALSATFPIFFSLLALARGLSSAATAMMGHIIIQNKSQQISLVVQLLFFAVLMALLWCLLMNFFAEDLLSILHVDQSYWQVDERFLFLMSVGAPCFVLGMVMNGLLIGAGQSKPYQQALMFGLAFEGGWVYWGLSHGWGMVTIPVGFIVAQSGICLWMMWQLRQHFNWELPRGFNGFWFENIRLSWPVFFAYLLVTFELGLVERFIHVYGGTQVLNGFFLGQRFEVVVFTAIIGLGNALIGMIGQHHAVSLYDRIKQIYSKAIQFGLVFVVVCMVFIEWVAVPIIQQYPSSEALVTTLDYFTVMVPALLIYPFLMLSMSAFQGVKKPEVVTMVETVRLTIVRIGVTWGLSELMGLEGIWLSTPVCNALGAVVLVALWQRYCCFRCRQMAS